jgi:hypothetical protein
LASNWEGFRWRQRLASELAGDSWKESPACDFEARKKLGDESKIWINLRVYCGDIDWKSTGELGTCGAQQGAVSYAPVWIQAHSKFRSLVRSQSNGNGTLSIAYTDSVVVIAIGHQAWLVYHHHFARGRCGVCRAEAEQHRCCPSVSIYLAKLQEF